jgi:twitching motility protein PilT
MAKIDAFFKLMHEHGASDLHLIAGHQPVLRIHGQMERVKYRTLEDEELRAMLYEITPEEKIKVFEETGDVDFAYEIPGLARYRANYFLQKEGIGAVFREIPNQIKTIDELGLPPILSNLAMLDKGLVLVCGPTGSGKSTTLAAIIDYANSHRKDNIITIEDPVEFVHESKGCVITHREVGTHTRSFSSALRAALREDPDIILVGEMRDLETISLALEAASTGHLVLSTVHTQSATKTVDRIIEVFPHEQQSQVRVMLSETLKAVISQTLLRRKDGKGRCVAVEVLIVNTAVANMIRECKTFQLTSIMQTGRKFGMQTLDDAIADLLMKGVITPEEAHLKALDKERFAGQIKGAQKDSARQVS